MIMKFKDKYNISEEFADIFSFSNEEEELEHDAQMLMYKFLEEIEKCQPNDKKFKKKDLADAIGKTPSFISQLYSGDKLLSFNLLAKIQKKLHINFEIKAHLKSVEYRENVPKIDIPELKNGKDGFWVWMNKKPDYSKCDDCNDSIESPNNFTAA